MRSSIQNLEEKKNHSPQGKEGAAAPFISSKKFKEARPELNLLGFIKKNIEKLYREAVNTRKLYLSNVHVSKSFPVNMWCCGR